MNEVISDGKRFCVGDLIAITESSAADAPYTAKSMYFDPRDIDVGDLILADDGTSNTTFFVISKESYPPHKFVYYNVLRARRNWKTNMTSLVIEKLPQTLMASLYITIIKCAADE